MRTDEEFIAIVHERAHVKRIGNLKRRITALSSVCALMIFALASLVMTPSTVSVDSMAGTSMLDSQTGGYVLVAVLAFMLGIILAVVIKSRRDRLGE